MNLVPQLRYMHGLAITLLVGLFLGSVLAFAAGRAAETWGLSKRRQRLAEGATLVLTIVLVCTLYLTLASPIEGA